MNNPCISPEVILKSRIRLARNIVDYPFSPVLNDACRKEIIEKVSGVLSCIGLERIDHTDNKLYLSVLYEENKISREFAEETERHSLFFKEDENIYVMVCEEDHLRLQSFHDGFDLSAAYLKIIDCEKRLSEKIKFAFDKNLGYLTHCPTNLGTAMRASVMMFLPGLTIGNRMGELKSQLEKIGVTVRGIYGEGSNADAYIYQVSNSLSLGISENDIISKIHAVAQRIATDELEARKHIFDANADSLTDKILRSFGILNFSHMISTAEFLECYAYCRLGICLGIINEISLKKLDFLLSKAMPAHIIINNKESASNAVLRDKLRAATVKKVLKEEKH